VAAGTTSYEALQRMTHERRAHFVASVVQDPEHDDDPRVRALFDRARARAAARLARRENARSDGE
jgi:hypothetical protein